MDVAIIRQFLDLLTRGLLAPREVARRVIDARPGLTDRLMMLGLAAALQGMLWAATSLLAQSGAGIGLFGHFRLVAQVFVNYALTALVAYHLGKRFGGRGTQEQVATAVAWHAMLTAALTPVLALAVSGGSPQTGLSGGGALLIMAYAIYNVWLLGACVAEAHGFASAARVAAVAFGLSVAVGTVLLLVFGGLAAMG
jgi:hypothetical protein